MIEQLFSIFGKGTAHKLALLTAVGSNVIRTFEQEFAQDKNARDAAIDTLIAILQKHKEEQPPPPGVQPVHQIPIVPTQS